MHFNEEKQHLRLLNITKLTCKSKIQLLDVFKVTKIK